MEFLTLRFRLSWTFFWRFFERLPSGSGTGLGISASSSITKLKTPFSCLWHKFRGIRLESPQISLSSRGRWSGINWQVKENWNLVTKPCIKERELVGGSSVHCGIRTASLKIGFSCQTFKCLAFPLWASLIHRQARQLLGDDVWFGTPQMSASLCFPVPKFLSNTQSCSSTSRNLNFGYSLSFSANLKCLKQLWAFHKPISNSF